MDVVVGLVEVFVAVEFAHDGGVGTGIGLEHGVSGHW